MKPNDQINSITKSLVSVTEMARMVSLSTRRFYQLVAQGVFPPAVYSVQTRKPGYTQEQQAICLEVRRRHCGVNGQVILFYARRVTPCPLTSSLKRAAQTRSKIKPAAKEFGAIREGLEGLGLEGATDAQIREAIRVRFPEGSGGVSVMDLVRGVFLQIKQRDSAKKQGT